MFIPGKTIFRKYIQEYFNIDFCRIFMKLYSLLIKDSQFNFHLIYTGKNQNLI
jgi:hypothetical protein